MFIPTQNTVLAYYMKGTAGILQQYYVYVATENSVSAFLATERLGMPRCGPVLAQAAVYLACAPKSSACMNAYDAAMETASKTWNDPVPARLQDTSYRSAERLGRGAGFIDPHEYPYDYAWMECMPDNLAGTKFWFPKENGIEKQQKEWMDWLHGMWNASARTPRQNRQWEEKNG